MPKNERLGLLFVLVSALAILITVQPEDLDGFGANTVMMYSALVLLSFSTLFLEHFFTRPSDVLAAAISVLLLLLPSHYTFALWGYWYWGLVAYYFLLVLTSVLALLLLSPIEPETSQRNKASLFLKRLSTKIGPGKYQYFLFFLFVTWFSLQNHPSFGFALMLYSATVLALNPQKSILGLVARGKEEDAKAIGTIFGVHGRNTFLVRLFPKEHRDNIVLSDLLEFTYGASDKLSVRRGIIIERFYLDQAQWIRVLCHDEIETGTTSTPYLNTHKPDYVYRLSSDKVGAYLDKLVGIVEEHTDIGTLKFLQVGNGRISEGDLIIAQSQGIDVLYQVVNGNVTVNDLESKNESDGVVGEAIQLGAWDDQSKHFVKHGWVPRARTPVMVASSFAGPAPKKDEFKIGTLPGTEYDVLVDRETAVSHHTAILGVTGVGKSVFARQYVRDLVTDENLKVIVVDFTQQWQRKMVQPSPVQIIDGEKEARLNGAINGYVKEKSKFKNNQKDEKIRAYKGVIFEEFSDSISTFVNSGDSVGVFELPDVTNTEGTLEYTQWFFKTIFRMARDNNLNDKRICIVLEEAHTVVPEWNFIGISDRNSQSVVNSIGQIALQGRKYGIGFVVIAQRTASVSKTVLTQCNTIISFQCFDNTSIEFLSNYYPETVTRALPNLRQYHAVAVGKAIRGSVPLLFKVPHIDESSLAEGEKTSGGSASSDLGGSEESE